MNSRRYAAVDATHRLAEQRVGRRGHRLCRSQLRRNGIHRNRTVGEAAKKPADTLQVGGRRCDDVHPAVGIVDPVDGDLVDAQAAALGEDQQLGVEEPAGVGDVGQQLVCDVSADRLESALGIREPGLQSRLQDQVVAARDDLALGATHHP
jgi:hypothetical protein